MVKHSNNERFDDYAREETILTEVFATRSAADWEGFLREHRVPAGRVRTLDEALDDPQLAHRGVLRELDAPQDRPGRYKVPVAPFLMSEGNPDVRTAPPVIGAHSEEILQEIGYGPEEIARLLETGAAASPAPKTRVRAAAHKSCQRFTEKQAPSPATKLGS